MAFDPSDYCRSCGDPVACGCPADTGTQDLMRCLGCGGQWWRPWGSSDTRCAHRGCPSILSLVLRPAQYPPRSATEPDDTADGPEECAAELVDGTYTYCGCPDCAHGQYEDTEHDVETGALTEDQALQQHALNGASA
ncbi:hypothetical protein [Streptomyces sp. NPDC091212]|uniref:hypothetical protein n=1 Tax=Streptomyces sp. NPDC091212 TaxID=3155191 RepID=UPI00342106A3